MTTWFLTVRSAVLAAAVCLEVGNASEGRRVRRALQPEPEMKAYIMMVAMGSGQEEVDQYFSGEESQHCGVSVI